MRPYGSCQRCGLRYYVDELKKEWTGLFVCPEDFDPRPAEMRAPRYKPEGLIVPNASPEPPVEDPPFDRFFDPAFFDTGEMFSMPTRSPGPSPTPSFGQNLWFTILSEDFSL